MKKAGSFWWCNIEYFTIYDPAFKTTHYIFRQCTTPLSLMHIPNKINVIHNSLTLNVYDFVHFLI